MSPSSPLGQCSGNTPNNHAAPGRCAHEHGLCYTHRLMGRKKVTIGLIQMSCGRQPAANLKKAISRIGEAAASGARIVCLQELFRSRYFCQSEVVKNFKLAEPIPGPSTEALSKVARQKKI